jgi:ComF family protein
VNLAAALDQLFLPAECPLCRNMLTSSEAARLVCGPCRTRWRAVRPPWCARCGQPEPHFGACRVCAEWPAALRAARSAVWLTDGAREAIHALKYGGLPRIAEELAAVMDGLRPPPDRPSLLIPIPLAPRRERQRGYNQSAVLATALSRRWGIPVRGILARVRDTPTQTALTPEKRLANVAGAFAVRNGARGTRSDEGSSTLILVDDVFTTGATLAEAARALQDAGAQRLHALTFARAAIPDFI